MHHPKILRPDSKGRITLGALASQVSGFSVTVDAQHRIILEPYTEIPASEKWLFKNKLALKKVQKGLQEAETGQVSSRGSFKKYLDDEHS